MDCLLIHGDEECARTIWLASLRSTITMSYAVHALFELAGKGFFFFFVVVKNGFDMFCNVVQVMLENTFTQFIDFMSSFESLL